MREEAKQGGGRGGAGGGSRQRGTGVRVRQGSREGGRRCKTALIDSPIHIEPLYTPILQEVNRSRLSKRSIGAERS